MSLADKITALQRKNAAATAPIPRSQRGPAIPRSTSSNAHSPPELTAAGQSVKTRAAVNPAESADSDFKRSKPRPTSPLPPRILTSSPLNPSRPKPTQKLFNPDTDPIPTISSRPRVTEDMSERDKSAPYAPRGQPGKLFDPRKDDPMRFTAMQNRQAPSAPSVYSSVASVSSHASSTFTLTSHTASSSASSAPPDTKSPPKESDNNAFVQALKKIYRDISAMEKSLSAQQDFNDDTDEATPVMVTMLKPGDPSRSAPEDPYAKLVERHKELADKYHEMLSLILQPNLTSSIHSLVNKHKIPTRLWTHGFYMCLEALRRASVTSAVALEHMTEFIYYGYQFYQVLYEASSNGDQLMAPYKGFWLEALGDLARCRMAVAARNAPAFDGGARLTAETLPAIAADPTIARIDDTPPPSVGVAAAHALELEPETEIWRKAARGWYATALQDVPGNGRLHHHLGLLSRENMTEELRGVYHFVKSMTALNGFPTSRESIQPLFASSAQVRRNLSEARAPELFVLLHGMLFTRIQLDDFQSTLARFLERLQLDGAQEREWIMMGITNVGALLEYGKSDAILRSAAAPTSETSSSMAGRKRELVTKMDALAMDDTKAQSNDNMDIDKTPIASDELEVPYVLQLSLQLTFEIFSYCLRNPTRRPFPFSPPTLNPYLTVILTFLSTIIKQPHALTLIEKYMPWEELIAFLNTETSPSLHQTTARILRSEVEMCLTPTPPALTTRTMPLPEDWCFRGMEWIGRRVYERGFWKPRNGLSGECDVLDVDESEIGGDFETDGVIIDPSDNGGPASVDRGRWIRVIRSILVLTTGGVPGLELDTDHLQWRLGDGLVQKVERWREEERAAKEAEERRRRRVWEAEEQDLMDLDISEEDEDDADEDETIRALKARRRELLNMQKNMAAASSPPGRSSRHSRSRSSKVRRAPLSVRPGYTVLVVDTNVLLSALSIFASLVESGKWTVVVPLAVITELDGLSSNTTPSVATAASAAVNYINDNIRLHSSSLKIQTSKGNYLSTLSFRSENFDFADSNERSMDDLIVKAAIWQEGHWADRGSLGLLRGIDPSKSAPVPDGVAKVVLASFDRNLRIKARARQLQVADDKDMAHLLSITN